MMGIGVSFYIQIRNWTGERDPLHTASSGKLFLAHAPESKLSRYLAKPFSATTARTITDPAVLRRHLVVIRQQGYD